MNQKREGATITTTPREKNNAKIPRFSDLAKILRFFEHTTGTTLDAAHATGVPRSSITRYVITLESLNLIRTMRIAPDASTGHMAKHYTTSPALLQQPRRPQPVQLSLFSETELNPCVYNENYKYSN